MGLLFVLSTSTKKYICEECADVPENFLLNIIQNDLSPKLEENISSSSTLETRVNQLGELGWVTCKSFITIL